MRDRDYPIALAVGGAMALILLAVSGHIEELQKVPFLWLALFVLPLLAELWVGLAKLLARRFPTILQFAKFALSGALNAFVDLGILNLLLWVSARSSGWIYPFFKAASSSLAIANSYIMNRFWTFRQPRMQIGKGRSGPPDAAKKPLGGLAGFAAFYLWTLFALLLNVAIASFIVNVIGPQWGISAKVWANIGAIAAVLLVCAWNFLGYKFIIFKK